MYGPLRLAYTVDRPVVRRVGVAGCPFGGAGRIRVRGVVAVRSFRADRVCAVYVAG